MSYHIIEINIESGHTSYTSPSTPKLSTELTERLYALYCALRCTAYHIYWASEVVCLLGSKPRQAYVGVVLYYQTED